MTDGSRPTASSSSTDATRIWEESEADAWFSRNRSYLESWTPESDPVVKLFQTYDLKPASVLEVGAANGFRVAHLADARTSEATRGEESVPAEKTVREAFVAVEPSAAAVADGARRYPGIQLLEGLAHKMPVERTFDVVIVNGVFTWIPRKLLLPTVAEVDRCVEDGGFLVVGDFSPPVPTRVPYHHVPGQGLYTWKQNYGELFQATGLYRLVARMEVDHSTFQPATNVQPSGRWAVWLLQKDLMAGYQEAPSRG